MGILTCQYPVQALLYVFNHHSGCKALTKNHSTDELINDSMKFLKKPTHMIASNVSTSNFNQQNHNVSIQQQISVFNNEAVEKLGKTMLGYQCG
jgi:delta-aminolevulinic acid dehydratase/porphobilinogen synthase